MFKFVKTAELSVPGSTSKANEDRSFANDFMASVIDGATGVAKNGRRFVPNATEGSDAAWLAQRAVDYLGAARGPYPADIRDYVRMMGHGLTAIFADSAVQYPDAEKCELPCAQIAIAQINNDKIQIARLGDVETLIQLKNGQIDRLEADPRHGELDRQKMVVVHKYAADHGVSIAEAKAANMQMFRDHVTVRNTPGHAGILNVVDTCDNTGFGYKTYNAGDVSKIMMMTDGFHSLYNQYAARDMEYMLAARTNADLKERASIIRAIEDLDDTCTKYPRFKKSDDATALVVSVQQGLNR